MKSARQPAAQKKSSKRCAARYPDDYSTERRDFTPPPRTDAQARSRHAAMPARMSNPPLFGEDDNVVYCRFIMLAAFTPSLHSSRYVFISPAFFCLMMFCCASVDDATSAYAIYAASGVLADKNDAADSGETTSPPRVRDNTDVESFALYGRPAACEAQPRQRATPTFR